MYSYTYSITTPEIVFTKNKNNNEISGDKCDEYKWICELIDGTIFNSDTHLYKSIIENIDKVRIFKLFNSDNIYIVDVVKGIIYKNNEIVYNSERQINNLIYFIRNYVRIFGNEIIRTKEYHLGLNDYKLVL